MGEPEILRRASYGPSSPVVGERGARTRQAIIDAALRCFEEKGFHATLVDDIASRAGVSRAGLYQYFESKEQLFIDLLHESGAALMRVVRRLGAIGPTAEGYDNLHWWLGEWAWIHDRYSTMFVQWSIVDSPKAPVRPLISQFNETCTARISARIAATGLVDLDPDDVAVALLAVLIRVNYYRHTAAARGAPDEVMLDTLATFVQMALFPDTPPGAFTATLRADAASGPVPAPPATRRRSPAGPGSRSNRSERPGLVASSEQARATVQRLLAAGSAVFAAHGYHASTVDEILREAGVGRGTFYKYFRDKLDLLLTLAEECADRIQEMTARFVDVVASGDPATLRSWLADFVELHRRDAGVIRVWTEREPLDPTLSRIGRRVGESILVTFDDVLGRVERPFPFDLRTGSLILMALLERAPDYAADTIYAMSAEQVAEVTAALIERGLLQRAPSPRRRVARR